jgi:Flp pilus assembly protein CpaB
MSGLASPQAVRLRSPRWLDVRLLGGLALVLGSVAIGTRVVAAADDTQTVWAVTQDLAAGTRLTADQLRRVDVRLTGSTPPLYLDGRDAHPAGYLLSRPVSAGELLPASAVVPPSAAIDNRRFVTVPIARHHFPDDLRVGEVVDLYVTTKAAAGGANPRSVLVAGGLTVSAVNRNSSSGFGGGGTNEVGVELSVAEQDARKVVAAAQAGPIDLVRIPSDGRG